MRTLLLAGLLGCWVVGLLGARVVVVAIWGCRLLVAGFQAKNTTIATAAATPPAIHCQVRFFRRSRRQRRRFHTCSGSRSGTGIASTSARTLRSVSYCARQSAQARRCSDASASW